jgi:predicted membrane protein
MRTRRERNPATQMIIGLFVIGIGLLFLIDNLGWLDLDLRIHILPTVLIGAGILKAMQTRSQSGVVIGGLMIAAGSLILLKEMGLIYIGWNTLWPLLMIAAGIAVVFRSNANRSAVSQPPGSPLDKADGESVINYTAIMGGFKHRITTQDFRGGEITAIMGGCDLDLRQSSINGDAVLNVFVLCGGITIKVPVDWTVVFDGLPIMGGFDEKTVPPTGPGSGKRLTVRGSVIMGGMEVRN